MRREFGGLEQGCISGCDGRDEGGDEQLERVVPGSYDEHFAEGLWVDFRARRK